MFRWTVFHYLGLAKHFTDTQCGFKLYKGEVARRIFSQCRTDGFLFDLEVLIRAFEQGDRVAEFPVRWACDPDSRLKPSRVVGQMVTDLRALKKMMAKERADVARGAAART
jgi:dolichyl-phosphate beta-glucosyltransferase